MKVEFLPVLLLCYFIGAIPFGVLVAKAKGINLLEKGSGNIGATNVNRILGPKAGIFVFILDVMKGLGAVLLCEYAFKGSSNKEVLVAIGGFLAVSGHIWSIFLRFKGGKGISTTLGILIGLTPFIALLSFCLWLVVVILTRYVSLGSILAAILVVILVWVIPGKPLPYKIALSIIGIFAIFKHKTNISRLLNHTESRLKFSRGDSS